jgi:hypothetical protein
MFDIDPETGGKQATEEKGGMCNKNRQTKQSERRLSGVLFSHNEKG